MPRNAARDAVVRRNRAMLEGMLNSGLDPNVADSEGITLLMSASFHGWSEGVELLLARGALENAQDQRGLTALSWSVEVLDAGVATLLLRAGADSRVPDAQGVTAFARAQDRLRMKPILGKRLAVRMPLSTVKHPILDLLARSAP